MQNQINEAQKGASTYKVVFNGEDHVFYQRLLTGAEFLKAVGVINAACVTLYQKFKDGDFEKISLEEVIDLGEDGIEHFVTKEPEVYNYTVDGEPETTDRKVLTPTEIMKLKGVHGHEKYLIQVLTEGEQISHAYCPDEPIVMVCTGMTFITTKWLELVLIEDYGKHCEPVPAARTYRFKIDKQYHDWHDRFISVNEIIELEYPGDSKAKDVFKFMNGRPKPVKLDAEKPVDLTEKCLIRFTIQPREQEDGLQTTPAVEEVEVPAMRRDFALPAEDVEYLDSLGFFWEAIKFQQLMFIVIRDYPIAEGYEVSRADVALMIAPMYPATQIDMAYFFPALVKVSGNGINNTFEQPIDGKTFQGWSRHRKAGEWRPGIDNISTHLCLVNEWLTKDVLR